MPASATETDALLDESSPAPVETAGLRYSAPPECGNEDEFRAQVEEVTDRIQWTDNGSRRFDVEIRKSRVGYVGTLRVEAETSTAPRRMDGASCEELVEALALGVALAVDPDALLGAPVEPEDQPPPPPEKPPPPKEPKPEPKPEPETPPKPPRYAEWSAGLRASGHFDRGPGDVAIGGSIGLEWTGSLTGPTDGWVVSARLEANWIHSVSPLLELDWLPSGRLELCPYWWRPIDLLRLSACGGGELGRLASSAGIENEGTALDDAIRTYVGVDLRGRIVVPLGAWDVEAFGGAELPISRQQYLQARGDGTDGVIYEIERKVGAVAGAGVDYRF